MEKVETSEKKTHPRQHANPLSIVTFWWTMPIFLKGMRKDLEEEDLFEPLEEHTSSMLGDKMEKAWNSEMRSLKPSLWRAIIKVFGKKFISYGIFLFIMETGLKLSQPLALGQVILYFTSKQTKISKEDALINAGIIVSTSLINACIMHSHNHGLVHLGMKVRFAITSLVYRKSLKLSRSALVETTTGKFVNLLSNDVSKFDYFVFNAHYFWIIPVQLAIVLYILYKRAGISSVIGVFFTMSFIPLQMYCSKQTSKFRRGTAMKTDERIRLMNEIILGIQVIKMYTWEQPFRKLVAAVRRLEIKEVTMMSHLRGLITVVPGFLTRFAVYISVLIFVLLGHDLTAENVFLVTSFYNVFRYGLIRLIPQGILLFSESTVSVERLQSFLLSEEVSVVAVKENNVLGDTGIILKNVSAKWKTSPMYTLSNITLEAKQGEVVAVIGTVGSGKSSLLQVILKELPISQGHMDIRGKVSYTDQEPWLFSSSIKQNILFGQRMDVKRYREVIKMCALEKDLAHLPYGDNTIVGERGVKLSGGQRARISLARAVYAEADIYLLDDPLSAVDVSVGKQLFEDCILKFLKDKCTILVTHQLQYLTNGKRVIVMENGEISASGPYKQLMQADNIHIPQDSKERHAKDEIYQNEVTVNTGNKLDDPKERKETGSITSDVYMAYIKAGGNVIAVFIVLLLHILSQVSVSGSDYFVTYWVNSEQIVTEKNVTKSTSHMSKSTSIGIYSVIAACAVVFALMKSIALFSFCMRASRRLHDAMFSCIVDAPMRFFYKNSSGVILNRFSKDMGSIDEILPTAIMDCLLTGFTVFATVIVISIVNIWMILPAIIILAVMYGMKTVYLSTTRNVKRIEGTTRSPIFSYLSTTLKGLPTIRAFGVEEILKKEFDSHQNLHICSAHLFISCARALGFWLDIVCVMFVGVVTFQFFFGEEELYGGNVGLMITQVMLLSGSFQFGIRQWSECETQMTSVERVVEYTKIESESVRQNRTPEPSWPELGSIQFSGVFMSYAPNEPHVLKNLNFYIKPKEKIGIVGRTGAGKSSLIFALFRLCEVEGSITIDGQNTNDIPLQNLRSKISIIPQEPVLFSGSLRKNLDPFDEYADAHLWSALEDVELKSVVGELPSGLNTKMSEGGQNFSVGQRQLLCLARAAIRNNRILVMDEATANVDSFTDALIQKTIRTKFADCTVLTIAHRLHTIIDSDKVLVMDAGSAVEFDHPHLLLENKKSKFYEMVQEVGSWNKIVL